MLLWSALETRLRLFSSYGPDAFVLDFLLNCTAVLLATTLYSSTPVLLSGLLLGPAVLLCVSVRPSRQQRRAARQPSGRDEGSPRAGMADLDPKGSFPQLPRRQFVTTYRGCMLVITCIAILAVDFNVFPRRFAKVETWGTSLMDLGVGSFVFSAGLVAARSVLKDQARSASRGPQPSPSRSLSRRLFESLYHSLPLLGLGLVRMLMTKRLEYQEHVTEYGVHWNFFFTLALLPPFVTLFQTVFSVLVPSYALLSMFVGGIYTLGLECTDLKKYVLSAPREDLLSMNREGIFSFWGYLSVFLAGQSAGMTVLAPWSPRPPSRASPATPPASYVSYAGMRRLVRNLIRRDPISTNLVFGALIYTSLFHLITSSSSSSLAFLSLTTSRRLANLPYVLWVCAFNNAQLLLFYHIHRSFFSESRSASSAPKSPGDHDRSEGLVTVSPLLEAFNRNGLVVFILANLLTGLINLFVDTLNTSTLLAMSILLSYTACLSSVAVGLDVYSRRAI